MKDQVLTAMDMRILQMPEEQAMKYLMPDEEVKRAMSEDEIIAKTGPMGAEVLAYLQETAPTLYDGWLAIGKMYTFVQDRVTEAKELRSAIETTQFKKYREKHPNATDIMLMQARIDARQVAMETVREEILFRTVMG